MYNLPYDLKLNICCYMDPNSLLNSYCICKSNLINKTDNRGWKFVSTFHLKEFEDINNFHDYRNIFYIRKYGIGYILETNLKSYIKESKWAMSWLELDDVFIDFCIKDIMKKKLLILQLREYEKLFKSLYKINQQRYDLGIGYTYLIDTAMEKSDNTKFSMYQYVRISGKENQLKNEHYIY